MRVAVFGPGGVGGYYGSRLAAGGAEVHLIGRGEHLDAIRASGLRLETADGASTYHIDATDDPATIGPVDVVLFCVKSYDTEAAASRLGPLLREDTAVVSLQNGVDNEDRIGAVIGQRHVVGGTTRITAAIVRPGVVSAGGPLRIVLGQPADAAVGATLVRFLDIGRGAGLEIDVVPDVRRAKWEKYTVLVAFSAMTASVRLPIGEVLASPAATAMLRAIITEAWTVGRALGVDLADDLVERHMAFLAAGDQDASASLAHDLRTGHRMELEALQGALIRLGRETGVPTPAAEAAFAILEPWAIRNAGGTVTRV
jgi:2-dehydropantoate 2-reductase